MALPDHIEELLKRLTHYDYCSGYDGSDWEDLSREAASVIRSYAERGERLEAALRKIADGYASCDGFQDAQVIANEALSAAPSAPVEGWRPDRDDLLERLRALDSKGFYSEATYHDIADDILALSPAPVVGEGA